MIQVIKHKEKCGDFNKAIIEVKDERLLHLILNSITSKMLDHHKQIEQTQDKKIKNIYQNKIDELESVICSFDNSTIKKR